MEHTVRFLKRRAEIAAATLRYQKKSFSSRFLSQKDLYLMVLPPIILLLVFSYVPMFGLVIAFKRINVAQGPFSGEWVGLRYFIQFFEDPYFFRLVRNTFLVNVYGLLFGFPAPILLALLFNEVKGEMLKRTTQSISYLPYFISTVVAVGLTMTIFSTDGVVNTILDALGASKQSFFNDPKWFRPLYVGIGIWQDCGYSAIIYLAAIAGIPAELYEAASIDGANRLKQLRHITLPGLLPTIRILLILSLGGLMNTNFVRVYLMHNPGIYETADVIETYIYRRGIVNAEFSFSTAVSIFNASISFIFVFTANYISKKTSGESLW